MASIQTQIEAELAGSEPDVEVLLAEVAPAASCACSSTTPTASRSSFASA